jgi:Uma2 family endonuclease
MATATRLTLEEWLARPDTEPAGEFVDGEVHQKPMPNLAHYILAGLFVELLRGHVRRLNLGLVGPELRCVFGPLTGRRGYVPDVAFVSHARLPVADARALVPFPFPPDLAVEILSPDQDVARFARKLRFCLRHGVRLIWVVDPIAETVAVHRPGVEPVTLRVGDTLDGADVLPGFTLALAAVFAELRLSGGQEDA